MSTFKALSSRLGEEREKEKSLVRYGEPGEQVNELRGQVVSLAERVTRLEEENRWLRQELAEIKGTVNEVRRNSVAILASILTVLVTVVIGLIVH